MNGVAKSVEAVLIVDRHLEMVEESADWESASNHTYLRWTESRDDIDRLLRVGTENWYILTYWERLPDPKPTMTLCSRRLTEAKDFGFSTFPDSPTFLWMFGYMISLFPFWFDDFNGDIHHWEESGKQMIRKASSLDPDNAIARMLATSEDSPMYPVLCSEVREALHSHFKGNTAIEVYFRSVLDR